MMSLISEDKDNEMIPPVFARGCFKNRKHYNINALNYYKQCVFVSASQSLKLTNPVV